MKGPPPARGPDRETRERIFAAAARLFAERGFRKVTVREICREASANVAAVNYHFGDKLGLYREVLRSAIDAMRSTFEEGRRAGEGHPPEEQFRRFLNVYLHRVLLDSGHTVTHKLISRELSEPTPVFDELVEQGMRPRMEYLASIISRMIGCAPSDPRVARLAASVQSQAIFYFPHPVSARLGLNPRLTPAEVRRIVDHIVTFSVGGIYAIGATTLRSPQARPAPAVRPRPGGA